MHRFVTLFVLLLVAACAGWLPQRRPGRACCARRSGRRSG